MPDELGVWIRRLAAIERPSGTHLPFVLTSAVALAAGLVRRRGAGGLAAAIATAAIVDELEGGRRLLRRSLARRRTYNVVAELGDQSAGRTVVFVSHHDVARPWVALFGALIGGPPAPFLGGKPLPVVASLFHAPLTVLAG